MNQCNRLARNTNLELILTPAVAEGSLDGSLPEEPNNESASAGKEDAHDLVQADALYKEGNALYGQKKYKEALDKYRESYKLSQSQKLLDFINRLEEALNNMEKANQLVREGNTLYTAQQYQDALAKYKESLKFHDNPEVENFIAKLEALMK